MQTIGLLIAEHWADILVALGETMVMAGLGVIFSVVVGLPVGTLLFLTRDNGLMPNKWVARALNIVINVIRSFPYLLFVFFLIPFTRMLFGTAFGVLPASVPIMLVGGALYSRYVEAAFLEVDYNIVERAVGMGADMVQVIYHFILPQSMSHLTLSLVSTTIAILSYASVMGIVGGGGIGDYAYRYGYQEYNYPLMYIIVVVLIAVVLTIQYLGNKLAKKLDNRKG